MTTVVVLVFADFVLRFRVGENCAVGIWRAKEPFQATDKPLFEGAPVALEGEEPSDGGGGTADTP